MNGSRRSLSFYPLAAVFALFVLFLYGPIVSMAVLSFQGPDGGLTFPMNRVSTFWFGKLMEGVGVVDIWGAFGRSLRLAIVVMVLTVVLSLATGLAFRRGFRGSSSLFYLLVSSLIVPSIVVSLGIGLLFRFLDDAIRFVGRALSLASLGEGFTSSAGLFTSALGAHLTWTLHGTPIRLSEVLVAIGRSLLAAGIAAIPVASLLASGVLTNHTSAVRLAVCVLAYVVVYALLLLVGMGQWALFKDVVTTLKSRAAPH